MTTNLFLFRRVDCSDGVSSYCEALLGGLAASGQNNVVLSGPVNYSDQTRMRRDALYAGASEWVELPAMGALKLNAEMLKKALFLVRKHSADVIVIQGFSLLPLASAISRLTGKKVVCNYHSGEASHRGESGSLKERLYYSGVSLAFRPRMFIASSRAIVDFFHRACRIPDRLIAQITLGIDIDTFRPPSALERREARELLGIPADALVCVLPARLQWDKGHAAVIEAIRDLRRADQHRKIICLLPGVGGDKDAIIAAAHQTPEDQDCFRFPGFLQTPALVKAYWAADVVLLPSKLEGFGLSVAEAMACGCVAIRTASGGSVEQIIEGETGFIVPYNDAGSLTSRIAALFDPVQCQRMSLSASDHARATFDRKSMVQKTAKLFSEVAMK